MNALPLHELRERLFPQEKNRLPWLISLALLAHGGMLAVLKIKQAAPLTTNTPVLQSTTLMTGQSAAFSPEDLAWLDWRDPSAPILPRGPLPQLPAMPPLAHEKSPPPTTIQPPGLSAQLPSIVRQAQDSLTAFRPSPREVQIETPPQLSGTVVEINIDRNVIKKTDLPQPEADRNLKVTICQIGIDALGLVEHALVDNSCGDPTIDQLAVQELKNWQFTPAPGKELQWSKAIIYWHFKNKAALESTP
jgi:TonB family protein